MHLAQLAARQGGVFTRAQAAAAGYSAGRIRTRVRRGEWQALTSKVLAMAGQSRNADTRRWIALLHLDGAVLSGPSAACLHGIASVETRPCVTVPRHRHVELADTDVFREDLSASDIVRVNGQLVTTMHRSVVDSVRLLPYDAGLALAERALQRRVVTLDALRVGLAELTGSRGAPALRRVVCELGNGTLAQSERVCVQLLLRAGIRGFDVNGRIEHGGTLIAVGDLVFREQRVVVELDGRAYHTDRDRFQGDRTRQNRLIGAGWVVLRFTWEDLTHRPDYVIATIAAALHHADAAMINRTG